MEHISTSTHPAAEAEYPHIAEQAIDLPGLLRMAQNPEAGAVVLFSGEVRLHNAGKEVDCLEYESHIPMAHKIVAGILEDARSKWGLHGAVCQHRVGKLSVGETAVVVVTSSAHRSEAYEANRYIIDRVKHEATIWKKEVYADGSHAWGSNCSCGDPAHQYGHPH